MKKVLVVLQHSKLCNAMHCLTYNFDELCETYPDSVRELTPEQDKHGPGWGSAWYDKNGFYKQQWDTSG